jgi:hypothetical protein
MHAPSLESKSGFLKALGLLAVLIVLMTLANANAAWADTFTVTNTKDSGAGSLRAAIKGANYSVGADEIAFADGVGGTITLVSTLPAITDPEGLTIDGGGDVTVSGNHAVRVLGVGFQAKLELRNLTVSDAKSQASGDVFGGGISNAGTLTLTNCLISGNSAVETSDDDFDLSLGGGIANGGVLTVTDSTFSGNSASEVGGPIGGGGGFGGGIYSDATLTVTDSTFSGNSSNQGGGILNLGAAQVKNTTFSGNSVDVEGTFGEANGGGIENIGTLELSNSTFFDNRANNGGGGLSTNSSFFPFNLEGPASAEVRNSTFSGNSAGVGGGVYLEARGTATLSNTIVANNLQGSDCDASHAFGDLAFVDGGYNVDGDGSCGFTQATGSLSNTDPLLDPDGLKNNGGPTKTIALQPNSPAVDLVAQDACPPPQTDQRGIERPQGDSCDSGAFELEQDPQPLDTTAPKVEAVSPSDGKTGVARATNLSATFSERMDPASITKATFKLFKCPSTSSTSCTTQLTNVAISKSADGLRATLNPFGTSSTVLAPTTKYKAVVTTGAEDAAGNALDQNPSASGNQQKAWYFTTGG